ncbi:MAG: glycosyltransferase [Prevotellaceae bacterium]|jgi:hypothetical protein|nr:glycosyltransferase [Prevotellaceae bacterium]
MTSFVSTLSIVECLLLAAVVLFFTVEITYWGRLYGQPSRTVSRPPADETTDDWPGVSVIFAARNEYEQLQTHLPLLLEQDYPKFEIVVVNDCSDDDTELLLATLHKTWRNLVFRTIEKDDVFTHSRKMALGIGVRAAAYDWLLFTDPNSRPPDRQWLRAMRRYFTDEKEIVIGYARMPDAPRWIRADHLMQAIHYAGVARRRKAYMADAGNLAYRRSLFFDNRGFDVRVTDRLREDIVFINKAATRANVAVASGKETTLETRLRYTPKTWRRRRLAELRTFRLSDAGPYYPAAAENACRILFFIATAGAAANFAATPTILSALAALLLVRCALLIAVCRRAGKQWGEKRLLAMCALWDLVAPLFYFSLIAATLCKPQRNVGKWTD